jgi:uncharacterized membrane protein
MNSASSTQQVLLATALTALLSGTAAAQVHPEKPSYPYEKCYGIVKAGMNDCFTASNSCAGTVETDNLPAAWIYVPKGTCKRITGSTLDAPTG